MIVNPVTQAEHAGVNLELFIASCELEHFTFVIKGIYKKTVYGEIIYRVDWKKRFIAHMSR